MVAYKQLNILKYVNLVKIVIRQFVCRPNNNKLTSNMSNYFMKLTQYHSVNTRNQATRQITRFHNIKPINFNVLLNILVWQLETPFLYGLDILNSNLTR